MLLAARFVSHGLVPPVEFQKNTVVILITADHQRVADPCGGDDKDTIIMACAIPKKRIIITHNPCLYPEAFKDIDSYAYIVCHEKAHINGWVHP